MRRRARGSHPPTVDTLQEPPLPGCPCPQFLLNQNSGVTCQSCDPMTAVGPEPQDVTDLPVFP